MSTDRDLRSLGALLLLAIALVMWQPHFCVPYTGITTEITLYACTDASERGVLTLFCNATQPHYADLQKEVLNFTSPPFQAPLHIAGAISIYSLLRSQENVRGTLEITLSELYANASLKEIRSVSVTTGLSVNPYLVIFGLGTIDYELNAGSCLRLSVRFSSNATVSAELGPTRLVLQVVPRIDLAITDIHGKLSTIFPENESGLATLIARVSIFAVGNAALIIQNSTGSIAHYCNHVSHVASNPRSYRTARSRLQFLGGHSTSRWPRQV